MKKVFASFSVAVLFALGILSVPATTHAASFYYNGGYVNEQQLRMQLIAQIQVLLAQLNALDGGSYYVPGGRSNVDVETQSVRSPERTRAQLMGEVDLNDEEFAYVWFEYGTSRSLTQRTGEAQIEENDPKRFLYTLRGLVPYRTYYYRAMAEDERGRVATGATRSFSTDSRYDDWDDWEDDDDFDGDEPDVETESAARITDSSAELRGEVEMNDAEEGLAFFAYGEDEDLVSRIHRDHDRFDDIDEEGDDLQVVKVDDNLDDGDEKEYRMLVTGLDEDTDYYFVFCVQFEDEDGDEMIMCGDVEDFTTDW